LDDILRKGCFKPEAHKKGVAEGEILPLMWVFTYKFDEDSYLTKFKTRLVVRGLKDAFMSLNIYNAGVNARYERRDIP
jgi:hypothetical protein